MYLLKKCFTKTAIIKPNILPYWQKKNELVQLSLFIKVSPLLTVNLLLLKENFSTNFKQKFSSVYRCVIRFTLTWFSLLVSKWKVLQNLYYLTEEVITRVLYLTRLTYKLPHCKTNCLINSKPIATNAAWLFSQL